MLKKLKLAHSKVFVPKRIHQYAQFWWAFIWTFFYSAEGIC